MAVPWPSSLSRDRPCIPDLLHHDRSDDPIPEQDSGLARLRESKTNIVIKGERADFDSLRPPTTWRFPRIRCDRDERHSAGPLSPKKPGSGAHK